MCGQGPCAKSESSLINRFFLTAALVCLTVLLAACPNPVSNDLVLSVVDTIPSNGATNIDPGQVIVVSFNKDLDPSCLQLSPVTISPNTGPSITLTFSYDSASRKLTVEPHPFLASNYTYTVSFETTLKDASGGALPKQVDLSFTTGNSLAGDVDITTGNSYDGKRYTNADTVTLYLQQNGNASPASPVHVRIAKSEAELSTGPFDSRDLIGPTTNLLNWPLDKNVEGPQTFYVQYSYASQTSAVRSAVIVRDKQPPTIQSASVSSLYYNMYNAASNPPLRGAVTASDATSGIASYNWTGDPGVTFDASSPNNSPQSQAIRISGPEKAYNLSLTVVDCAGNPSDRKDFAVIKDTVPPDPPTATLEVTPSPWFSRNGIKWSWNASTTKPNLYPAPDTFQVLLNDAAPDPAPPPSSTSYGPISVASDGTYALTVVQMDAAGNKSAPLSMPIVITPVDPPDGSTNNPPTLYLQWRDFANGTALQYKVHIRRYGEPGSETTGTMNGNMQQAGPYDLNRGQEYEWYIEWSLDGTHYDNRSPSTAGTYHRFRVIQ